MSTNIIPTPIFVLFLLTTLVTVACFAYATSRSVLTISILGAWLIIQGFIAWSGFYTITDTLPPRFILMIGPPLLGIVLLFTIRKHGYISTFNIDRLTILHTIRIPVEWVLYLLADQKLIPSLMTFEGRNWDIISGLSAPVFYYLYKTNRIGAKTLFYWNLICLALLANIVIHAALSAPSVFQQLAFEQPNIAILYVPLNWLPSVVVPIVLCSHLISIRMLNSSTFKKPNPLRHS